MFCANCGKSLPTDSQFCPSCGRASAPGAAPPPAAPVPPPAAAAPPPPAGAVPPPFQPASFAVEDKPSVWERFKRLKTWVKVLLGIVLFIFAVIALAMCATSGLDKPVERHFAALHSGDVVAAYSELSVAARQQTSLEDFKAMLAATPALNHVTGESYNSRELNNGQGSLQGTLELEGGGKLPIEIHLVKENDEWKILAYHVTPAKSQ